MIHWRAAAEMVLVSDWLKRWPARPLIDSLRRQLRQRRAALARQARQRALAEFGAVQPAELIHRLRQRGICEGDVVFFQGSLKDMPTFGGTARDLLAALLELVGSTGTLVMPAFTTVDDPRGQDKSTVFDPSTQPTYTGLVNEMFRRSPGVVRSIHPRHSVCAVGPLAEQLTQGHERCERADGPGSPLDKLRHIPTAKILTLGLPPGHTSFLHWVEDLDPQRFPLRLYEPQPVKARVRMSDGTEQIVTDWRRRSSIAARLDVARVAKRLSPAAMEHEMWCAIPCAIYPFATLASELLSLRDRGIVHYR